MAKTALALVHGLIRQEAVAALEPRMKAHGNSRRSANRLQSAERLAAGLADWAQPLLKPARYKCLWGGRGCISGDTLIDTPNGLIRVDEFIGGEIYAFDQGRQVIALAGRPVKYDPEPLYKVKFSDGASIKVTARHRFLTDHGWLSVEQLLLDGLQLSDVRFVSHSQTRSVSASELFDDFSEPALSADDLRGLCSSASPSASPSDALHCWRILLGFLYCCSEYFRQCGLLPPQAPDTYLEIVQQLVDELPRKSHTLKHTDALVFEHIRSLSQPLCPPSILDAALVLVEQCSETQETRSVAKFSELLLKLSQVLRQFPLSTDPLGLVHRCAELALAFWLSLGEVETVSSQSFSSLRQLLACDVHEIQNLFGRCDDTAYSDGFSGCSHDLHYTLTTAESIDFVSVEPFYDLFVPFFNNYSTEGGIVNHNSGKSFAIADALLIIGLTHKIRVLCAREFQVSIKDSVHALLKERITALGLEDFYLVQRDTIIGANDSAFIFKGVHHNVQSIKSMAGITHCWLEEAQTISAESWQVLIPTIREEGSEIWVSFNPLNESDTVYQELVVKGRSNAYVERVNWDRNPHFPSVLDDERRSMQATDPDAYHHIWEGGFWEKSDAQILSGKWIVEEFFPGKDWDGPYYGADFGFAQDPTTLVKCWIHGRRLHVEYESWEVGLELDHTADRWKQDVPDCEAHTVWADSARPESISYLKRHGIPKIAGVTKWKGSVEDGIAHLRSYETIVIHPRCRHTIEEARLYSYKVDRLSGAVLPVVLPRFDHVIDGIRYGISPVILKALKKQVAIRPARNESNNAASLRKIF